jgi:ketose-bisphosphate aldolase
MGLVTMTKLLADAQRDGYGVCYCESWNLESFQGTLEAAEEAESPIIMGFNGGFLNHPGRAKPENLAFWGGMGSVLRAANVPVAFILNETDDLKQIELGVELGFNAVMVENQNLSLDEYRQLVKKVVALAHGRGVAVEAQIGHLGEGLAGAESKGDVTDPLLAKEFSAETGIDALSVSVGNVHIATAKKSAVDLEALRRIHEAVRIPLVIHGGTGFPLEQARDAIGLGVAKVNFGTGLKQAYLAAVRERLQAYREPLSPHPFLGMGGKEDILVGGRDAVKHRVKALLQAFGSVGKAKGTKSAAQAR